MRTRLLFVGAPPLVAANDHAHARVTLHQGRQRVAARNASGHWARILPPQRFAEHRAGRCPG